MQPTRPSIWWHDPIETASGKPGTLQRLEVGELDVTLFDQRLDAKIDRPKAHAKLLGDLTLRGIGPAFEKAQHPEMHVLTLPSDFVTDHGIDRYSSEQSYRTAGDSAPSVTAAIYEQAEASRSFLNVYAIPSASKRVFRRPLDKTSARFASSP